MRYKNILESLIAEIGEYVEPVWSIEAKALLETHPDTSRIWPQFAIFLMLDETQCAGRHPQCHIVAELYKKELDGEKIDWVEIEKEIENIKKNIKPGTACLWAVRCSWMACLSHPNINSATTSWLAVQSMWVLTKSPKNSWHAQSVKLLELLKGSI